MQILQNQLLADYTTTKIGGRVRWMFFPRNTDEVIDSIRFAINNRFPFFILAGGSNVIFDDINLKFRQIVINTSELNHYQILDNLNHSVIEVEPGVKLQKVVDLALQNGLKGMSSLNRIPGTVGGAVVGNAGAYGVEIGDLVQQVEFIDIKQLVKMLLLGELSYDNTPKQLLNQTQCNFRYRQSFFKDRSNLFVSRVWLNLAKAEKSNNEQENYSKIASFRDKIYPADFVSPGSVFKNILVSDLKPDILAKIPSEWIIHNQKIPVARLLEQVDSKTFRVGGISMRATHANIMVNHGGAKFHDVETLINELKYRVWEKFKIKIEPEIRLVSSDFSQFKH